MGTMTASELRQKLFDLIEEHGDLPVVNENDDEIDLEYNADADPAFVVYLGGV